MTTEKVYTGFDTKKGEKIYDGDEVQCNCITTNFKVEKGDGTVKYDYRTGWVLMGIDKSIMWHLNADTYVINKIITKVTVDFFKDGGKFYTQEIFETNTREFESLVIECEIEEKFCKLSEDMCYTYKAERNKSVNYRLVK